MSDDYWGPETMTLDEYAHEAARTIPSMPIRVPPVVVAALGISGEAGELAEHVKHWAAQGHELDATGMLEETGDLMWYINLLRLAMGWTWQQILASNIAKLRQRYPDGFSVERSVNREASGE